MIIDSYRDSMARLGNLGRECAPTMNMRTGIDVLDHRLGYIDMMTNLPRIGLPTNRMTYIVANSGVGKTTLSTQISRAAWTQYPEMCFTSFYDKEQSMSYQRVATLEPFSVPIPYVIKHMVLINQNIYTETFESGIRELHRIKMEAFAKGVKVPALDSYNNHIHNPVTGDPEYMPPPTIVILDSLYMLTPQSYEETSFEDGTNMDNARIVAANSTMLKAVVSLCEEANIMLIVINHIRKKINTSRFPTPAQLNYLKPDESLPGGDPPIYLSRTLGKLVAGKKLKGDEDYGIDGYVVTWLTLKSLNSRAGMECQMIYDPVRGFDNDLSNLHFLRTSGLLEGRGWYQIPGHTRKFTLKNFKQLLWDDRDFALAFQAYSLTNLMRIIPTPGSARIVDAYSGTIMRDSEDPNLLGEKIRAAMTAQCSEKEVAQEDKSTQRWYAVNVETNARRWLEPVAA